MLRAGAVAGLLCALPMAVAAPGGMEAPDHLTACGGFAPLTTDCNAGTHDFGARTFLGPDYTSCTEELTGVELPEIDRNPCFVGDVQAVAEGGGHQVRVTCSFARVYIVRIEFTCVEQGTMPEGPASVTCHARRYHTADPAVAGSGEPAALGEWACHVAHDW